jgi:deazaflavin-dependent oxidoreductase (nitroreductase family)
MGYEGWADHCIHQSWSHGARLVGLASMAVWKPGGIVAEQTDRREYNRRLIEEFRANRGGGPMAGRRLLLLTTSGAKSGRPHTAPMMYIPDGERLLVIASNIGAPSHPDWYRNLVANPDVTVEVGDQTYAARASTIVGAERERIWAGIVERYPFFAEHQAKTARQIPVVALERREPTSATI